MQASEKIAIWEEHMLKAQNFNGSNMAYCQEVGLSKSQFGYWKIRLKELRAKTQEASRTLEQESSAFIPVEIRSMPTPKKVSLPDAKWMAEFLVHFINSK